MAPPSISAIARAVFSIGGRPVNVLALQTGTVTVKKSHSCCSPMPEWAPYPLRFATIVLDRRFADPMPVWTYAIDHPDIDGLVVVDAGSDPTYNDAASWKDNDGIGQFVKSFIRLDMGDNPEDAALPAQLKKAGYTAGDVKNIVLTHQHIDHTGTVPKFPQADVWTTEAEDSAGETIGSFHFRWRNAATKIRHIDTEGTPHKNGKQNGLGNVVHLCANVNGKINTDNPLDIIHTPGHTPGSVSVRLRTDQGVVWFTGDTSFSQRNMDVKKPTAGIHTNMGAVRKLHNFFSGLENALILPSHDWSVAERLSKKIFQ